jgi:hypothetical protein
LTSIPKTSSPLSDGESGAHVRGSRTAKPLEHPPKEGGSHRAVGLRRAQGRRGRETGPEREAITLRDGGTQEEDHQAQARLAKGTARRGVVSAERERPVPAKRKKVRNRASHTASGEKSKTE